MKLPLLISLSLATIITAAPAPAFTLDPSVSFCDISDQSHGVKCSPTTDTTAVTSTNHPASVVARWDGGGLSTSSSSNIRHSTTAITAASDEPVDCTKSYWLPMFDNCPYAIPTPPLLPSLGVHTTSSRTSSTILTGAHTTTSPSSSHSSSSHTPVTSSSRWADISETLTPFTSTLTTQIPTPSTSTRRSVNNAASAPGTTVAKTTIRFSNSALAVTATPTSSFSAVTSIPTVKATKSSTAGGSAGVTAMANLAAAGQLAAFVL